MPRASRKRSAVGPFVLEVQLKREKAPPPHVYPFSLPIVRSLDRLTLHPRVTFLLGENGTGKSTLLEAVAIAMGINPEGGSRNLRFQTRASHSNLGEYLRLVRGPVRPLDAFFVRSETFYTMATALEDPGLPDVLEHYGDMSLHDRSRGEALLTLVTNRLGTGFYLFDEPESGLSPTRQMAFLAAMHQMVRRGSQLIVSTHSPILLAYPDACIYELSGEEIVEREYEETDHYRVTADFFEHRPAIVRELCRDE